MPNVVHKKIIIKKVDFQIVLQMLHIYSTIVQGHRISERVNQYNGVVVNGHGYFDEVAQF